MTIIIYFFFVCFIHVIAFNPKTIPLLGSSSDATHELITRCAFATVTNEYLQTRYKISSTVPTITNGICPSSFFSQLKQVFKQVQQQGANKYSDWEDTIDYIVDRNSLVDVLEQLDESRHFDSESFIAGSQIILDRYKLAVKELTVPNYQNSNEYFGKLLHTLQDFYSHSNWIEMDQRQPQPDLGLKKMIASQFAGPTVRTCINCSPNANSVCYSNNDIKKGLTSGYFVLFADILTKKPTGKCSHGGSSDATRDNDATGGITKDTAKSVHGYLHIPAAQTAYLATCKILRQFRTEVQDNRFGLFLNVLNRQSSSNRLLSLNENETSNLNNSTLVYTSILNKARQTKSFSSIQQIVTKPASDSFYKAHLLSIAHQNHITIDILRSSKHRRRSFDFGQDLARLTGGLYLYSYNQDQQISTTNQYENMELIDLFYSKQTSDNISINIDKTCLNLRLDFITNDTISTLTIQLKNIDQLISPSSILTDTITYKSYLFTNISSDNWQLVLISEKNFTFNLRVLCSSEFRCYSRIYVNNDNAIHPGLVQLEGNMIQNKTAILITNCDNDEMHPIDNMSVILIDEFNGEIIGNPIQSINDTENDRWITNLTNIPSKSFRFKYFINNQQIQRLSHLAYQPSLIDVEILNINSTLTTKTIVNYRLYNYHSQTIVIKFLAKNIGSYMEVKYYVMKANENQDDQIEFDQNSKADGMIDNMLALTVRTHRTDWNYDVITI